MKNIQPIRLGVNLDHIATVRQARRTHEPDPVYAALLIELGGADQITIHLREDRRHVQDRDLRLLRDISQLPINQEMAITEEMLGIALDIKPEFACLVPEKAEEITTEGGLDVVGNKARVKDAIERLHDGGIQVSIFIDPHKDQLELSRELGAEAVELHTGDYSAARGSTRAQLLERLQQMAEFGGKLGLQMHAGHGLSYQNVSPVARIPEITELNIGHSIVARSVYVGLQQAVAEMRSLMDQARTDARLGV